MKIAIDARFYGTENGGLGRYTVNLLGQITKLDKKNQYFILLRDKYYKTLTFPRNFIPVLIQSRHYSLKEQFEVVKVLNAINPDITHFLHFNVPYFYNKPFIVTIHDLLMHQGVGKAATTLSFWKYAIKRLGYRKVFDHAIFNANKIISPTEFVKDEIGHHYKIDPQKIRVIYEGVTPMTPKNSDIAASGNYFLYVGNAYPHKNLKTLIKSVQRLPESAQLVLVTPRDVFTKRLKECVKELNAESSVVIKMNVTDEELATLYRHSLSFVYPSFSEGFGLPGLEAMLMKTRLLASDIPVFHEVYKEHALYFDPHDWEDLTSALLRVIQEKKENRKRELDKAYSFVQRYSWEEMARATLALYES